MRDAGHLHAFWREAFREVVTRGIAFHVRAERENDFLDRLCTEALLEICDSQILRLHAVERRNLAAKHVKLSVKRSRLLDADDVHRPFDNADQRSVASRIGADGAGNMLGQSSANRTGLDAFARVKDGLGELFDCAGFALHKMQRQSLRRTRPDARQRVQRREQLGDGFRKGGHGRRSNA